jgi:hypothetical protein
MTAHRRPAGLLLFALLISPGLSSFAEGADEIEAKCQKLLATWKDRLDEERFAYVVAPPFVIAGNGGAERLKSYRDRTILAATRCLQKQFFDKHPAEPVLILLFETEGPYKRLAKKWLADDEVPYYGYFRHDNVMLMNVGTGTGTLVHELTHALIKPDFPSVPSWFNEGLASLYEQCSLGEDDTIKGHENWRLPALQKTIRADKLRPLAELIADPRFYDKDLVGTNYAQARYLMFYLQHKGLLQTYYQAFRDGVKDDPSGLNALKKVIGPQSLDDFEKQWRAWVLTLRFGER